MLELILTSDGYREQDRAAFERHVDEIRVALKAESWYSPKVLGVRSFFVASKEPGTWVQPGKGPRDTAFRFELGKDGTVARLISGDVERVRGTLDETTAPFPIFYVGVLCNTGRHGGWGGPRGEMFWVCAGAPRWTDTAFHEMGHSLFNLRDEYGDDTGKARRWPVDWPDPEQPNVTTDPTGRKWAHITDTVFEGAARYDFGIYRPFDRCRMRQPGPFCLVCADAARRVLEGYLEEPLGEANKIRIATADGEREYPDDSGGCFEAAQFLLRRQFG